jgi:hypothetical protein
MTRPLKFAHIVRFSLVVWFSLVDYPQCRRDGKTYNSRISLRPAQAS